jgi:hypothetical protein
VTAVGLPRRLCYTSLQVRFRSKLGPPQAAFSIAPAFLFGYGWLFGKSHRGADGLLALAWLACSATWFSVHAFTFWDFESSGLRERRLWKTTMIPWTEVTYIGPWQSAKSKWIAVEYERKTPLSDRGRIVAIPARREAFIAALRQFAPQAQFEI